MCELISYSRTCHYFFKVWIEVEGTLKYIIANPDRMQLDSLSSKTVEFCNKGPIPIPGKGLPTSRPSLTDWER